MFDTTYIDNYKEYLTDVRGASVNTVSAYIRDITQFADYLHAGGKHNFTEVTEIEVRRFVSMLSAKGRSPATVSRCLASLKAFYARMTEAGFVIGNPTEGITSASAQKKEPRILTGDEIISLLEQPDTSGPKGCRDKAMLETLYATGIKVSELTSLDLSDVNLETALITCRNGKVRTIPIYETAVNALRDYFERSRPLFAHRGEKALFVNTAGSRMSRQGFWKVLKGYTETSIISEDISPQMMRHSFAAHLLENGVDLHSLQEMLGHADISSTQVYARIVKSKLKDVYNKAHPRA